jgi:hypothetical protein
MSTEINIADLTEGVTGQGVFDKFMRTVSEHLLEEFQKGRITGVNYSNVYLGSINTVMAQSIEFLLRKNLTAAQVDLTKEQIANTIADTELKLKQVLIADTQTQIALKELEIKEKEVLIAEQQLQKVLAEVQLINKQVTKTDSEIALLNAKKETELGQTSDAVTGGIVAAQRKLFEAQTQGFTNDHFYKMTKTKADIYSVMLSQDPDRNWALITPPEWVGVN